MTPPGATGDVDVTVDTRGQTVTAPRPSRTSIRGRVGAPINTFRRNTGFNCSGGGKSCQIMTSFLGVIADMARRQAGDIANSCRAFGGNEKFVEDVIADLRVRTGTNRWAMNIKRGNQGLSEDIITYYYGPEGSDMRNSTQVYIVDIIANHCNPADRFGGAPFWLDQTQATADAGTIGRWTLGSMCSSDRGTAMRSIRTPARCCSRSAGRLTLDAYRLTPKKGRFPIGERPFLLLVAGPGGAPRRLEVGRLRQGRVVVSRLP